MATSGRKTKQPAGESKARVKSETPPKFPYTTKPGSLRRLLKEVPTRPRPGKINKDTLKSWGFSDSNDQTMIRVLKSVGLLGATNEPTELYTKFMSLDRGAAALGPEIQRLYAPLFQSTHLPHQESNEKLKNLFNIYSGGGDRVIEYQMQTFKALCENAIFDKANVSASAEQGGNLPGFSGNPSPLPATGEASGVPIVNINLHIHLPENKARRDYEDIIEDIGRYIFGRNTGDRRN